MKDILSARAGAARKGWVRLIPIVVLVLLFLSLLATPVLAVKAQYDVTTTGVITAATASLVKGNQGQKVFKGPVPVTLSISGFSAHLNQCQTLNPGSRDFTSEVTWTFENLHIAKSDIHGGYSIEGPVDTASCRDRYGVRFSLTTFTTSGEFSTGKTFDGTGSITVNHFGCKPTLNPQGKETGKLDCHGGDPVTVTGAITLIIVQTAP